PLVQAGHCFVRHPHIVALTSDIELVGAGAQGDVAQLLDAREVAVVHAIKFHQDRIVVERDAAGGAHAATPYAGPPVVAISPARLLAWPSTIRVSTMRPISRALPSA